MNRVQLFGRETKQLIDILRVMLTFLADVAKTINVSPLAAAALLTTFFLKADTEQADQEQFALLLLSASAADWLPVNERPHEDPYLARFKELVSKRRTHDSLMAELGDYSTESQLKTADQSWELL